MFSDSYRKYVLGVLTLVYTLNFCDRALTGALLQPIKEDLQLSDTQLGFLTGIAYALFYATLGIPVARWADRGNRVTITSLAMAVWGVTVASCLFVTNFVQLLVARVAAAVGEAGCMPPTYSLVGDYFPKPAERPRAIAIYMLAGPLASLVGFVGGGWLNDRYGWRTAFLVMGLPALAVALLVRLTVVEPRLQTGPWRASSDSRPRFVDVLRVLWTCRSFRHLSIAFLLLTLMGYGLGPWYAAFLMRSHGMSTTELGVWLGVLLGFSGVVGILTGGYVTSRWFGGDEPKQLRLIGSMTAALLPGLVLFLTLPDKHGALVPLTLASVLWAFFFGPTFALMQRLVSDGIRATAVSIVMLFANLIGMGVGAQLVGILSDLLRPTFGNESLRYAMLTVCVLPLWAAYEFRVAGRSVLEDLSAALERDSAHVSQSGGGITVVP